MTENPDASSLVLSHEASSEAPAQPAALSREPTNSESPKTGSDASPIEVSDKSSNQAGLRPSRDPETACSASQQRKSQSDPARSFWLQVKAFHWHWELLCWFGSLLCFLSIVVVLAQFQGRRLPDWPYHITVNTIVSILSSIAAFLLGMPIASALGQTKWMWIQRRRPLSDFALVDEASRGVWGSLILLVKRRGGILAATGATLTILTLAIGPFVQQIVQFPTEYVNGTEGRVPVAQYYHLGSLEVSAGANTIIVGLDAQIIQGVYSGIFSSNTSDFNITATCPTDNCVWPTYQTLAICNTCQDLSSQLSTEVYPSDTDSPPSEHYVLPNGFGLQGVHSTGNDWTNSTLNMTASASSTLVNTISDDEPDSIAFWSNGSRLASFIAVTSFPTMGQVTPGGYVLGSPPQAYECLLQFCIRSLTATMINGTFEETVESTSLLDSDYTLVTNGTGVLTTFNISSGDILLLSNWLAYLLTGDITQFIVIQNDTQITSPQNVTYANFEQAWGGINPSSDQMEALMSAMNNSIDSRGFPELMGRLADSLTLALRTLNYQPPSVEGISRTTVSIVAVSWPWITLPLTLLSLGLGFLLVVIIDSEKRRVLSWKSSVLAALFHGPDRETLDMYRPLDQLDTMDDAIEGVGVEMINDGDGGHMRLITEA